MERAPDVPRPSSSLRLAPVVIDRDIAYVSGVVAFRGSELPVAGQLGAEVETLVGRAEARQATANLLHRLRLELGTLRHVRQVLKLTVFVNSAVGYRDQPTVADGASDLLQEVLGERSEHARSAIGVAALPLGAAVEVELIARVNAE